MFKIFRKPRMIVYVDPKTKSKIHLRIDPTGIGVLVINASRVVYLNRTATFFIEHLLKGFKEEEIVKKALRKFKKVDEKTIRKDLQDLTFKLNSFIRGDVCPITYLGFKRIDPFTTKLAAPFRVDIALTYACNNKCVHCYSASPRPFKNELSTEKWFKVIDKLAEIGVPNILFTGGEPTLRNDLPELIRHAEEKGLVTGLVTNGRKLSNRNFLHQLVKAGLDYIQVTLESNRPEVHDKITGVKGSWEETVKGIKNILEEGVYLDVNTTLNKFNIDHLDEWVDFLYNLGVKNVSANKLIYSGHALKVREWFEPTTEETTKALETLIEETALRGMTFRWYGVTRYCEYNSLEHGLGLKFCSACSITLGIEPNGDVIPCQSYYQPLGNILKDKWSKIWYHPLCQEIRERKYAPEICRKCPFFQACGGGCPLEAKVKPYNPPKELVTREAPLQS